MTAKELKEWADSLPPDVSIEFMLAEVAKGVGYTDYRTSDEREKNGGWITLEGEHLRAVSNHPDRRPAQVAERLSK